LRLPDHINEPILPPIVSVVLPVHNGESTILEAVTSVLDQSSRDLELIVINDGSTDATVEILSSVTDPRMSTHTGSQSGPAASRNQGIAHARGNFIAFIDADDLWLPEKLTEQMAAFDRMPEAAAAYCWIDYVSQNGVFVSPDGRAVYEGMVHEQMLTRNFIDCGSNIMVRRQVLLDEGGFDESLPVVEDWDLSIRLSARHIFVCVPRVLVLYRQSPSSLSTRVRLMEESYQRVINRTIADSPEQLEYIKARSAALFYEYLTGKSTQGIPNRDHGRSALRYFARSVRSRPANLLDLWQRPWVLKAIIKAMFAIVLPSTLTQWLEVRHFGKPEANPVEFEKVEEKGS
jgi:glycosyltransferase involved in cell wall biosynthesis